jgi:hypothetical protein
MEKNDFFQVEKANEVKRIDENTIEFRLEENVFSQEPRACSKPPELPNPIVLIQIPEFPLDKFKIFRRENNTLPYYFITHEKDLVLNEKEIKDQSKTQEFPILIPKGYELRNKTERKMDLVRKYIYLVYAREGTIENYLVLVKSLKKIDFTFHDFLLELSQIKSICKIDNFANRIKEFREFLVKTQKLKQVENDGDYMAFLCLFFFYFFDGGSNFMVFDKQFITPTAIQMIGQEMFWIMHLVNPSLEKCYKEYLCDAFRNSYVASYEFKSGESFCKYIHRILCYGLFVHHNEIQLNKTNPAEEMAKVAMRLKTKTGKIMNHFIIALSMIHARKKENE